MLSEDQIVATFYLIDDFLLNLAQQHPQLPTPALKPGFPRKLHHSEVIAICILFQFSKYRSFKNFYTFAQVHLKKYFPNLVSYSRFVTLRKEVASSCLFFSTVFLAAVPVFPLSTPHQ